MITISQTERITSQKKIVSDYLKSVTSHPSAEQVYLAVRKKLPRISRGTVYRILKNLKEKGEAQEVLCKICHYDGDTSPHAHFFCQKCGKIFDVFDTFGLSKIKKLKVGEIKNYQINLYGFCKNCQKK